MMLSSVILTIRLLIFHVIVALVFVIVLMFD